MYFNQFVVLSTIGLLNSCVDFCSAFIPMKTASFTPTFFTFYSNRNSFKLNSLQHGNTPEGDSSSSNNQNSEVDFGEEECPILYDYDRELIINTDLPESDVRQARKQRERSGRVRFETGDKLVELRKNVATMHEHLKLAQETNYEVRISALTEAIASAERKDPDLVYARALDECSAAETAGEFEEAAKYWNEAKLARENIAQFNLHGLWVGKYGSSGYQMVNITYVGDTLIATKVTGDKNVPKGEVTFVADLSPQKIEGSTVKPLEPITLSEGAAKKWGTCKLNRFHGKGQIASENFTDAQWVEGQLIMVGDYFSFAWVPIGHQIFFGRPSLELTLKMLKEDRHKGDGMDDMRSLIARCYDESDELEELEHQQIDWNGFDADGSGEDGDLGATGVFE